MNGTAVWLDTRRLHCANRAATYDHWERSTVGLTKRVENCWRAGTGFSSTQLKKTPHKGGVLKNVSTDSLTCASRTENTWTLLRRIRPS